MNDCDFLFKICLVGDRGVGKKALIRRYLYNSFQEESNYFGDFFGHTINIKGQRVKLQMWHPKGLLRYSNTSHHEPLPISFYRSVDIAVVVFDVSNPGTFRSVPHWIQETIQKTPDHCKLLLVGNKADMEDKRQVIHETALQFAEGQGLRYVDASAKSGLNVDQVFTPMVESLLEERMKLSALMSGGKPPGNIVLSRKDPNAVDWCLGRNSCSAI